MTELLNGLPFLLFGLIGVTLIDSVGAIASRKLQFNYGYLTPISLAVYGLLGYLTAGVAGSTVVILYSLLVGFYDATVGMYLSRRCNANLGELKEYSDNLTHRDTLGLMLVIAPGFALLGYLLH